MRVDVDDVDHLHTLEKLLPSARISVISERWLGEGGTYNVGMTCFFPLLLLRPVSLGRLRRAAAYRRHRLRVTIWVCFSA